MENPLDERTFKDDAKGFFSKLALACCILGAVVVSVGEVAESD